MVGYEHCVCHPNSADYGENLVEILGRKERTKRSASVKPNNVGYRTILASS